MGCGVNNMKQKYRRGDRVLLKKEFPFYMVHFPHKGEEVLINYSSSDRYGRPGHGGGYSVLGKYKDRKGRKRWGSSAWYEEVCIEKFISHTKQDEDIVNKNWNK